MDYNGTIIDAFNGYSEQAYACGGVPITFSPGGGTSGEDQFSLVPSGGACSCPFMGTNDGGLSYDIVELTANTLRIHTQTDDVNCNANPAGGYFTYIFTKTMGRQVEAEAVLPMARAIKVQTVTPA